MGNQIYWLAAVAANGFLYIGSEDTLVKTVALIVMFISLVMVRLSQPEEVDKRQ